MNFLVQVLYWLSGLTCSDENFIIKSGAQRVASIEGVALIAPDTSPSESFFMSKYFSEYPIKELVNNGRILNMSS